MELTSDISLIAEFKIHLSAERNLSPNTVDAYERDLLQFAEVLEQRDVTLFAADTADVAAFIHHLATHEIEPRSRARKIATLRTFYRWLIVNERLDKDPMRLTVLPKISKTLPKQIQANTVAEILKAAQLRATTPGAPPTDIRDYAMLETLYGSGIRVSELCTLQLTGLNLDSGTVHVRGKGDKERIVPVGAGAVTALRNYIHHGRPHLYKAKAGTPADRRSLFLSEQGTQITRQRVWQITSGVGGDEATNPHRFRHSCATHMLLAGGDLRTIQDQLGHARLGTTEIYTGLDKGQLKKSHAKFHPRG